MPAQYAKDLEDRLAKKPKLGIFGKTARFRKYDDSKPGPGFYETQVFKSLSKGELSIMGTTDRNESPS